MLQIADNDGKLYTMEHSLYSMSLWESNYSKSFLDSPEHTVPELDYYMQCMSQSGFIPLNNLSFETGTAIMKYITTERTATRFTNQDESTPASTYMSTELIYGIMTLHNIPWEAQYWHFSRLQTLLRVMANLKTEKKKKAPSEVLKSQSKLNEERRKMLGSKG